METTASTSRLEPIQQTAARIVGFFYLFTNATAIVGFVIRGKLMLLCDPAQTGVNIVASERLFRTGIALELVTVAGVLVLLWVSTSSSGRWTGTLSGLADSCGSPKT